MAMQNVRRQISRELKALEGQSVMQRGFGLHIRTVPLHELNEASGKQPHCPHQVQVHSLCQHQDWCDGEICFSEQSALAERQDS